MLAGERQAAERYLVQAKRLDDVSGNLINRVRRPDAENQATDRHSASQTCEAAGLQLEARGWYLLAIERDLLDAAAQRALLRDVFLERPGDQINVHTDVSLVELDAGSKSPKSGE